MTKILEMLHSPPEIFETGFEQRNTRAVQIRRVFVFWICRKNLRGREVKIGPLKIMRYSMWIMHHMLSLRQHKHGLTQLPDTSETSFE